MAGGIEPGTPAFFYFDHRAVPTLMFKSRLPDGSRFPDSGGSEQDCHLHHSVLGQRAEREDHNVERPVFCDLARQFHYIRNMHNDENSIL